MSSNSVRRATSFAAALCWAALSAFAPSAPAVAAAAPGTLFGLGPSTIFTIDPVTGTGTTFVNLPMVDTFPGASFSNLESDPAGHRLFTERTVYSQQPDGITATYQIVTVDTTDAAAPPIVSADMPSGITDIVFDPSSNSLFGQTNMYPFELVRIDPTTGAQTTVADIPGLQPLRMTIAPAKHAIYMPIEDFSQFPPVNTIATFLTTTGAVSQSQPLATGIVGLEFDAGSGSLYGKTFCCPARIVKVNPSTGAETTVVSNLGLGSGMAIDPNSHSIFLTDDELGPYGFNQFLQTVNLQTATLSTSSGPLPTDQYIGSLAFEGPLPSITPDSIKSDVQGALGSGAISNAGVGNALLAELNNAQAARNRGQCGTAANIYQAFINDVTAQSGKAITASTAAQLSGEAQFLIANCP